MRTASSRYLRRGAILAGVIILSIAALCFGYRSMVFQDSSVAYPYRCPLHGVPIVKERIRSYFINCALMEPGYIDGYQAAKKDFKYSGHELWDCGCPDPAVRWIEKKLCPQCRLEEQRWQADWSSRRLAKIRARTAGGDEPAH